MNKLAFGSVLYGWQMMANGSIPSMFPLRMSSAARRQLRGPLGGRRFIVRREARGRQSLEREYAEQADGAGDEREKQLVGEEEVPAVQVRRRHRRRLSNNAGSRHVIA